jgi:hypothetical protein
MSKTLGTKIFMTIPYFLNRWAVFKTPVDDGAILANWGCHNRVAQPERFLRISRVTIFRSLHLRNVLKKKTLVWFELRFSLFLIFPLKSESCFLFWSEHLPFIYFFWSSHPSRCPGRRSFSCLGARGWWVCWLVNVGGETPWGISINSWMIGWLISMGKSESFWMDENWGYQGVALF